MPLAGWIVLAVVGGHGLLLWLVADQHLLPRVPLITPAPTPNFGVRRTVTIDPQTGAVTTRNDFVVSTTLAMPSPQPQHSPGH